MGINKELIKNGNIIDFDKFYANKLVKSKQYRGILVEEFLFEYYWKKINFNPQKNLGGLIKYIEKIFVGGIKSFFKKSKIYSNFTLKDIKYKNKIFFIMTFTNPKIENANKMNEILERLVQEFNKEDIILIVFNKEAYKFYKSYNVIYLEIYKKIIAFKKINLKELFLKNLDDKVFKQSRGIKVIELGEKIVKELSPKCIITTQDYYYEDNIFTQLGKKYLIPTISHLHGLILKNEVGAYKYYFSDYIMVWGERDIKILEQYLPKKKIIAAGCGKFKSLLKNKKIIKKNIVLCMTDISNEVEKEKRIVEVFSKLKTNEKKIIKIHPGMNEKEFIKKYEKILKNNIIITKKYDYIEKAKYLLTYKTTAIIDGLCCGASVIEIYYNEEKKESDYLEGLEESIIRLEDIEVEIYRRENQKEYFIELLNKQEKVLKKIIYSFEAEKIEKDIINKIVNKEME